MLRNRVPQKITPFGELIADWNLPAIFYSDLAATASSFVRGAVRRNSLVNVSDERSDLVASCDGLLIRPGWPLAGDIRPKLKSTSTNRAPVAALSDDSIGERIDSSLTSSADDSESCSPSRA